MARGHKQKFRPGYNTGHATEFHCKLGPCGFQIRTKDPELGQYQSPGIEQIANTGRAPAHHVPQWTASCHHFATVWECARRAEGDFRIGGVKHMARALNELLLLSCMAAFVTGIVVAAASLII